MADTGASHFIYQIKLSGECYGCNIRSLEQKFMQTEPRPLKYQIFSIYCGLGELRHKHSLSIIKKFESSTCSNFVTGTCQNSLKLSYQMWKLHQVHCSQFRFQIHYGNKYYLYDRQQKEVWWILCFYDCGRMNLLVHC